MQRVRCALAGAVLLMIVSASFLFAQESERQEVPSVVLPQIEVISTTPVPGTGIDKDKLPANVQGVNRKELDETDPLSLGDLLNTRIGSATLNHVQVNPFQPDIQFRGFTAGPLLGTPQGISVYQNGTRINEPFGDVMQWDLIPEFAIDSVNLIPGANPVFGLNTLGGALAVEMKNGFTSKGGMIEAYGDSWNRWQLTGEYGGSINNFGYYLGVTGFDESGWRDNSPSDVQQVYADGRWVDEFFEAAINFTYANTDLTGNGPAPVELLDQDRDAVFTYPDNTKNRLYMIGAQGNIELSDTVSLQGNVYYRNLRRDTLNGDELDLEACEDDDGPPGTLCEDEDEEEEEEDEDEEEEEGEQVEDRFGNPIPVSAGGNGAFNTSRTKSEGVGGSLQATITEPLFGLNNHFVLGFSVDYSSVDFSNMTEVGALTPDRTVTGSGIFLGGDAFNTDVDVTNLFVGAYFSNTLSITDALALTLAGRFNHANIDVNDNLGTALTSDNTFNRFNPALGLTYQLRNNITAFANYGESNRAPTAAELGCSDPEQPCRFPNAFVADPPLDDVITRSVEAGFRGWLRAPEDKMSLNWSVAGFFSRNADDILFVGTGTPVGAGFFSNVGDTQRVGFEIGLDGIYGPWSWYAKYSYVDATFQEDFDVLSPGHPSRDDDGLIQVESGNRIPGIPQHSAKFGLGINIIEPWFVGADMILAGSQHLRGDESNQLDTVDGYALVNLRSRYRFAQFGSVSGLEAFVRVNNLFNAEYETFGIVGESPEEVLGEDFTNSTFLSPGAPIGAWAGLRFIW